MQCFNLKRMAEDAKCVLKRFLSHCLHFKIHFNLTYSSRARFDFDKYTWS